MTELVTSGSVGGMASNGCLYPEVATHLVGLTVLSRHTVTYGQLPIWGKSDLHTISRTFRQERPYMDSSSFANTPLLGNKARLLTYIRPLIAVSIFRCWAIMGYSRVNSLSLSRAFRTWTFSGFVDAGSTCSPSSGLFCNRV